MTREQAREQRWLWRGIATLVVLAVALFGLTTYSVVQQGRERVATAERAERVALTLQLLAGQLDRQASALERQASQLEDQADRAETSRRQFRRAAQAILEEVGSTVEAFDPPVGDPEPRGDRAPSSMEPAPSPSPTAASSPSPSTTDTHRGCRSREQGPPRCRSGG